MTKQEQFLAGVPFTGTDGGLFKFRSMPILSGTIGLIVKLDNPDHREEPICNVSTTAKYYACIYSSIGNLPACLFGSLYFNRVTFQESEVPHA